MTTTENDAQATELASATSENGTAETTLAVTPEVKYPTYLDLAKATWKLGYDLSAWGEQDVFCVEGVNGYLRHFGLPELREIDGNTDVVDKYLNAWHTYTTWTATGEVDPADDQNRRERLVRSIRVYLQREQPRSRERMNEWLTHLGLELIAEPKHTGAYHISHNANVRVNSEMITRALNAMFPEAQAEVRYDHRVR